MSVSEMPGFCFPSQTTLLPQTLTVLQHCPLALEGLSGVGFRYRLGAEAVGPGKQRERQGPYLWQARQEVSLSGTLKPGMENSECPFDRMKSWVCQGSTSQVWAGLSCGARQTQQS